MSSTATKSRSAPRCFAARKKLRPIRPNPLTPIFTVMGREPPGNCPISGRYRGDAPHAIGQPGGRPGRRPGRVLAATDVSMHDPRGQTACADPRRELPRDDDRPVMPAGAADRDREVALPLRDIPGKGHVEERLDPVDERGVQLAP